MNKKIIPIVLAALLCIGAFAQGPDIMHMQEIASVESETSELCVFSVPIDGQTEYFLDVGGLGLGDKVVQIVFDPVGKLFIPLGGTFKEAMVTLRMLQEQFKEPKGTTIEMEGCFAPLVPNADRETVKVTTRKLLISKQLEFTIEREGYIRSAFVQKSDFSSLMFTLRYDEKVGRYDGK